MITISKKNINNENLRNIDNELINKLSYQISTEDNLTVAKAIHEGEEIDGIYTLKGNGLLDSFYEFLKDIKLIDEVKTLKFIGVKRVMISMFQYILMYILKVVMGIQSINGTSVLLTNPVAMKILGFNAHQIEKGICQRGKNELDTSERGIINPVTLANNVLKVSLTGLVKLFNVAIKLIAKKNIFPPWCTIIIDGSDLETTEKYENCGSATRDKKVKNAKNKENRTIKVTVFGFKLLAAIEKETKIPVAIAIDKINCDERGYVKQLITQAEKNLNGKSNIKKVLLDRGFLDGEILWWINKRGIKFVIPAKSGMIVKEDSHLIALNIKKTDKGIGVYVQNRLTEIKKGKGKNLKIETYETELVGIKGLKTYTQYCDEYSLVKGNSKNDISNEINSVVVRKWNNKDYGNAGKTVFLTNEDVSNPFDAYDDYDDRSTIENCLFKESKQAWNLKNYPSKTEKGVKVHIILTMLVFALVGAYKIWNENDEKLAQKEPLGTARWRRKIEIENQNKVIVFYKDKYAILYMAEVTMLLGLRVKDRPAAVGTMEDVLKRYGLE